MFIYCVYLLCLLFIYCVYDTVHHCAGCSLCITVQGDAIGQSNLACVLYQGIGGPADLAAARNYYTLAAANGNCEAQCSLGDMLQQGKRPHPATLPPPLDRYYRHLWIAIALPLTLLSLSLSPLSIWLSRFVTFPRAVNLSLCHFDMRCR